MLILFKKVEPVNIIENKLDITLPSSFKIIKFDYNGCDDYFDAKILLNKRNVDSIKKELEKCIGKEFDYKNKNNLPNFENVVSWWDMDKNNIEVCYFQFIPGKKHLF